MALLKASEHGTTYRHDGSYVWSADGDPLGHKATEWRVPMAVRVRVWEQYKRAGQVPPYWKDTILRMLTQAAERAKMRRKK